jgi:AcrR family transcriptional regulator
MSGRSRKEEYAAATRAALIAVARELFAVRGFAEVSIDEIARGARVTKGALYHHFDDKVALFRAVVEAIEADIAGRVRAAAAKPSKPWDQLVAACHAYLDACMDRDVQRIVVLDAASVLGWKLWCEIDKAYGLGVLQERLAAALAAGLIEPQPLEPAAQLVLGALNVAGRVIAEADDAVGKRAEVSTTIDRLLSGLRSTPAAVPVEPGAARSSRRTR